MLLLEVHHGLFAESSAFRLQAPAHEGWTLITPIERNFPQRDAQGRALNYTQDEVVAACPFLREAADLDEPEFEIFIHLIQSILNTAQSGLDWPKVMNKAVHEAGYVNIKRLSGKNEAHTIIQFGKLKTLIRVHAFISAAGRKLAFISHVFEKPKNSGKTPSSEQTRAKINLQAFLDAVDAKQAEFIDIQGGKNGFDKLV